MSFIIETALIFTGFLTMFQGEEPFIHILCHELQRMLSTLMLRFRNELLDIDVSGQKNQLPLESMNVRVDVKALLKKCSKNSRKQYQKDMQETFIKIAYYFSICTSILLSIKAAPEKQLLERHDTHTSIAKNSDVCKCSFKNC